MKVGDMIKFKEIRAELREYDQHPFRGKIGLIVGVDDNVLPDYKETMFEVLFVGFSLTRWVHSRDCEVVNEAR
tara:strand:- start:3115 stop:3333 length:219 start_codon:yes stop_codon:yes gene_type:complete